jgi:hypothetical protein
MGTNFALLLAEPVFIFIMRLNLFKNFFIKRKNYLLWPSVQHFDILAMYNLLTISIPFIINSVYPNELEIRHCCVPGLLFYLDILLKLDDN